MTSKRSTTKSETHSEGCPQQMSQPELLSGAREGRKVSRTARRQGKRKSLPRSQCRKQEKAPWIYLLLGCGVQFFFGKQGSECSLWLYPGGIVCRGTVWPLWHSEMRCSGVAWYVSCPAARTSCSSKERWFPSLETETKIWALGALTAIGVSWLLAPLSSVYILNRV